MLKLRKIVQSPMNRKKLAISTSLFLSAGIATLSLSQNKKVSQIQQSVFRVANLLYTTSVIVCSYGFSIYIDKHSEHTAYSEMKKKLKLLQSEEEFFVLKMIQSADLVEANHWKALSADAHHHVELLTEEMSEFSSVSDESLAPVHLRNAIRLRDMCATNRGVYIKLGQHISMLDHIIPKIYQEVLSSLLADNPRSSWESVCSVFREDLGAAPDALFDRIEREPIASASLAQVHVAWKNGKKYAVKVQHEGLLEGATGDMAVITLLIGLIPLVFEGFDYGWLTKEMNRNLPLELDFTSEMRNLDECRRYLASLIASGDLAVPVAELDLSSKRIITMSFEEGCYVSDTDQMRAMQLNNSSVSKLISRTFCEQIYHHGFVHCDPHEANLLVRPHPWKAGQPQLVLLDHGLYRKLDDGFRRDYCRLWQALVLGHRDEIELYCRRLGAGSAFALLAGMLTLKPSWDEIGKADIASQSSKQSKANTVMLQAYADRYLKQIVILLGAVPSELLLLFKTGDCLRHLDKQLGTPINTSAVVASVTSDVILGEDLTELRFNPLDLSKYAPLCSILGAWMNVKMRVVGLELVGLTLSWQQFFQSQISWWTAAPHSGAEKTATPDHSD